MKKTTIEFIVGKNGSITSTVKEIKGPGCAKISESLKQGLGKVTDTRKTSEYYETAETSVRVKRY